MDWFTENYLTSSVHTAQVCICGRIPKSYASICGSSTRCKQTMEMGWPGNSFDSCRVLSILQYRLYWMRIPNKKLDKGGMLVQKEIALWNPKNRALQSNGNICTGILLCCRCHQMQAGGCHKTTWAHKPGKMRGIIKPYITKKKASLRFMEKLDKSLQMWCNDNHKKKSIMRHD